MVAPALCIPCMAAATTAGPAAPLVIGVSSLGAAGYYSLKKSKKKKKRKSNKKKKKKTKQRGGSINLKKDMNKIYNKSGKCRKKCSKDIMKIKLKKHRLSRSIINKKFDRFEGLSPEEKKQWNKQRVERNKCWSKCYKIEKNDIKLHKKKYSKEYREINKEKKKDCCKCRYVKSGKTLRKVRGPWSHCSYDMENCCKDKKTIVKSKK